MSTTKIGFDGELAKIIFHFSSNTHLICSSGYQYFPKFRDTLNILAAS